MRLTKAEIQKILSEDNSGISQEFLTYLKRHYPVYEEKTSWDSILKFIKIDDKIRPLLSNKKYLVDKIFSIEESNWISLGTPKIRRTIKYYLDGIK